MEVEGELRSDPLVSALPARAVEEDVVAVLRHVFHHVVGEAQVRRRQAQELPELGILDVDPGFFHLFSTKAWMIKQRSLIGREDYRTTD